MLTPRQVTDAVAGAGIEVPARWLEATGSTNTDVLAMARAGAPEWTILVAGHQTTDQLIGADAAASASPAWRWCRRPLGAAGEERIDIAGSHPPGGSVLGRVQPPGADVAVGRHVVHAEPVGRFLQGHGAGRHLTSLGLNIEVPVTQ